MTKRFQAGDRVTMNQETVERCVRINPDYRGVGVVVKDDRSGLPYLVRFDESGATRWFTHRELLMAERTGFRLVLSYSAIDGDGDVRNCFVTNAEVDPYNIPMGIKGRKSLCGYTRVVSAVHREAGRDTLSSTDYSYAYAVVDGVLVCIPNFKFGEPLAKPTKQLEIGAVYRMTTAVDSIFPHGTLVTVLEQEPEDYTGLAYRIQKVNIEQTDWVSNQSVFEKI